MPVHIEPSADEEDDDERMVKKAFVPLALGVLLTIGAIVLGVLRC